jgi:hypothetical protein
VTQKKWDRAADRLGHDKNSFMGAMHQRLGAVSWYEGRALLGWLVLGYALGCQPSTDGGNRGNGPSQSPTTEVSTTSPTVSIADPIAPRTRFARLSHLQWNNAVNDLLGLEGEWSGTFLDDPLSTFSTRTDVLKMTAELHGDQQRASEAASAALVADPAALAAFEGPTEAWLAPFLRRAFRRPATPDEVASYLGLAEAAPDLMGDTPEDVVALVVQGVLQSPHFVYRMELVEGEGAVPLDDWELAARLAFALWNTVPDEPLLDAAAAGRLSDPSTLADEVDRLLADPRAREGLQTFHNELFGVDGWAADVRDPVLYPGWVPEVLSSSKEEIRRYVDTLVWEEEGSWSDVLTTPRTHVDAALASVYGVPAPAEGWVEVDLDPTERAGVLTLSGFLTSNADALVGDPIHRGVWVVRRVLCADLPPPPPGVGEAPPAEPGQSNRERVEALTGEGTCGEGCHSTLINPAGFAFEHYDAIGGYRDSDEGRPVDASDAYPFDGSLVAFDNAVDFVALAAGSDQAHACYVGHQLEYLHGRLPVSADATLLELLTERSLSDASVRELVRLLVVDRSFTHREDP